MSGFFGKLFDGGINPHVISPSPFSRTQYGISPGLERIKASTSLATSSSGVVSNIKSPHSMPWYIHYGAKPIVGAAVGYGLSSFLYPGASLPMFGKDVSRNVFVAGAMFAGFLAAEIIKEKVWEELPKGVSTVGSTATEIGIVAGIDYLSHITADPTLAQDLSKQKVLMESAGAVIAANYLTAHFVLPWLGYETGI